MDLYQNPTKYNPIRHCLEHRYSFQKTHYFTDKDFQILLQKWNTSWYAQLLRDSQQATESPHHLKPSFHRHIRLYLKLKYAVC